MEFNNCYFYLTQAADNGVLESVKTKVEDAGEPSKFEKENLSISLDGGDNASSKSQKKDKFIYKMPIYEPLQKAPDGVETSVRIPEPIKRKIDLEFFDKTKKVR